MSAAGIEVRTERKWRGERGVEVAESYLRQKELVGTLATGTAGLGLFPKTQMGKARGKERHQLIQEEVRLSKTVGLRQSGRTSYSKR